MLKFIEFFGNYSCEAVQFIAILCLLYSIPIYLIIFIYAVGLMLNVALNKCLKKMINPYMPSGHFQSIFYSLTFVFLIFYYTQKKLFYKFWKFPSFISSILIIFCLHNCIKYHYHSLLQIFIGSLIGIVMGWLTFSAFLYL